MLLFVLALAGSALAGPTDQESVRVSFSQKGLDFGEDVAYYMIDIVQQLAGDVTLPKITGDSFELTNMKFGNLNLGKPEISIVPNVGIKWKHGAAVIQVAADWAIQTWWWNYGTMTLDASLSVEAIAGIKESNGKLATEAKGCAVHFNSFNLDLHNALFTWIAGLMEGSITPEIRNAVCGEINTLLSATLNSVIATLPHDIPVADVFDVEIAADSNPVFESTHFDISARVIADSQTSDVVFPFSPEPMNDAVIDPGHMACVLVSDYTLNTASYMALQAGKIVESVPNEFLSSDNPIFNTAYFSTSLPQLYTAHPDAALTYKIENTRYPKAEFDHDNVILDMPLTLSVQTGGADIAVLSIHLTVEGNIQQANTKISGAISSATHVTSVDASQIGDIDSTQLEDVIDAILENTVLPTVNSIFQEGVVLPIDQYLTLHSGVLEAHDDFVKICADITLTDFSLQELKKIAENLLV